MTQIKARCYCGVVSFDLDTEPEAVTYCHCGDCRRWTGAPVAAFAAIASVAVNTNELGAGRKFPSGTTRWNCADCGSPLLARFDYLPGQSYIPIGIISNAADFEPGLHCHADSALPWLKIDDALPRSHGSGRETLRSAHLASDGPDS